MKFLFLALVTTFLLSALVASASVPGSQSFECSSPDSNTVRLRADVWMTGHPMGGFTSFEGVMQIDDHTFLMHPSLNPFAFYGSTNDLSRLDYSLLLGGLLGAAPDLEIQTTLKSRTQALGPKPAGNWVSEPVKCEWMQQ